MPEDNEEVEDENPEDTPTELPEDDVPVENIEPSAPANNEPPDGM